MVYRGHPECFCGRVLHRRSEVQSAEPLDTVLPVQVRSRDAGLTAMPTRPPMVATKSSHARRRLLEEPIEPEQLKVPRPGDQRMR